MNRRYLDFCLNILPSAEIGHEPLVRFKVSVTRGNCHSIDLRASRYVVEEKFVLLKLQKTQSEVEFNLVVFPHRGFNSR